MHVRASLMCIIYKILVCNGHDMLNQILNNASLKFHKVKPDTGYQWHDYSRNWSRLYVRMYIQAVQ